MFRGLSRNSKRRAFPHKGTELLPPRLNRLAYYRANSLTDADGNYDITAVSNPTDTVLTAGHTYSLYVGLRAALGSVDGVDHWAFNYAGVPKVVSYETIQQNSNQPWGYIFWSAKKGLCVFDPATPLATMRKVWKYMLGYSGLWFQGMSTYGDVRSWPTSYADYFVDSVRGNNSNDGLSPLTPFATISALSGRLVSGVKIGLAAGSYWREELNGGLLDHVQVCGYGSGKRPVLDSTDIATNAGFSLVGGTSNVYSVSWTHSLLSGSFISVWEDGVRLKYVGSDALCDSTPGSYFVGNPATSPIPVKIHASDSSAVSSNGKSYSITRRKYGVILRDFGTVSNVHTTKNGTNDGSIVVYEDSLVDNCMVSDGTKHNLYIRSGTVSNTAGWKAETDGRTDSCLFVYHGTNKTDAVVNFINVVGKGRNTMTGISTYIVGGCYGHGGDYGTINYSGCSFGFLAYAASDGSATINFDHSSVESCRAAFNEYGYGGIFNVSNSLIDFSAVDSNEKIITSNNAGDGATVNITNSIIKNNGVDVWIYGDGHLNISNSVIYAIAGSTGYTNIIKPNTHYDLTINNTIVFGRKATGLQTTITSTYSATGFTVTNSDNNVYYPSTLPWLMNNVNYANFAAYMAGFGTPNGIEAHSITQDPLFVDSENGNFALRSGSPAIAIGAGLSNPNLQFISIPSDEILAAM